MSRDVTSRSRCISRCISRFCISRLIWEQQLQSILQGIKDAGTILSWDPELDPRDQSTRDPGEKWCGAGGVRRWVHIAHELNIADRFYVSINKLLYCYIIQYMYIQIIHHHSTSAKKPSRWIGCRPFIVVQIQGPSCHSGLSQNGANQIGPMITNATERHAIFTQSPKKHVWLVIE